MRYAIVRFTNCVDFENAEEWGLSAEGTPKKMDVRNAIKKRADEKGTSVGGFHWEVIEEATEDYWVMTFNEILTFDISDCPRSLAAWEIIVRDETPLQNFVKFSDAGNDCSIKASREPVGKVVETIFWEEEHDDCDDDD